MSCFIIAENGAESTRSPKIWNYTFQMLGLPHSMRPVNIARESFQKHIQEMILDKDFQAMLITNPYKHAILNIGLQLEIENVSKSIDAVNLIYKRDGKLLAINTDSFGASQSFFNNFSGLQTKEVWMLGMGGAGKAVYYALKNKGVDVLVASRSNSGICREISRIEKGSKNIILINATGVAFKRLINQYQNLKTFVNQDLEVFDLRYKDNLEDLEYFTHCGIRYVDGLEMNLIQAAAAFSKVYADNDIALTNKINEIIKNYE